MNDKLTNVNLGEFLNDYLQRSETVLLEESKEADDILSVAKARGYVLEGSNDLAGFKTIYTFDTKANINKARLPKELLLKALPGIIGKPVDIDHNRIYVVGHYIDYRYVTSKNMVIAYGVFYKSNFGEEWEKAKQLFKAGKLGTSYEIWCAKSKRKYLPDGTYVLTSIEIAGGGLMFKEKPAFPDAKVLELAMKHIDEHTSDVVTASAKKYEASELFFSGKPRVYDALVGNLKKTVTPTSDQLYQADELIGRPVTTQLPAGAKAQGMEKPVIGLPNPTHTTVGMPQDPGPANKQTPGSLVDLQQKNALQNTGLQPQRLQNDNLKDNVSVPGPQIVASVNCQNCKKDFVPSAQTFQRKNSIDFYEVAKTDDMHQCPGCKSIVNREGYMLHPPQVIDFAMACPGCRSNNWRILSNEGENSDARCMGCGKTYHLQFAKEETNPIRAKMMFMRCGYSSCPQCGNNIPYSTTSNVDRKNITCPKCNLHYSVNLTRSGNNRQIVRANEFVSQEDNYFIGPGTGDGSELKGSIQKASVDGLEESKKVKSNQPVVIRPNQQITDMMASVGQGITKNMPAKQKPGVKQNNAVDNKLTKNRMTDKNLKKNPNQPMNEGAAKGALYIVRHGKTELNDHDAKKDNDRIRGWVNVPLDATGRKQAKELGKIFKGQKPDAIYSSDLSRARDTADEISKNTGVPVESKFDLRPWNLGKYNGQQSKTVHPEIAKYATETPNKKVEGGESFNNFKVRALNFGRKLMQQAKEGKMVVAVTHTRVAKLLQAWILAGCPDDNSIDNDEFMKDTVKTGSIHKVEPVNGGVQVTEEVDLQKSSVSDSATESSEKGESKMEKEEMKQETPTTEAKTETVNTPTVEAQPVQAAETAAPVVEEEGPIVDETATEVEDAEAVEQEEALEVSKTLKAEDRNALPNQKFAVIKTVKDKKSGGTRTVRKYPIHDKAHVQNALSRLNQKPSREGLRKLGVSPDAVIKKVKAAGKKMGMEVADMDGQCNYTPEMEKSEMEGYAVASKGRDMQKGTPRGKDNMQEKPEAQPNNYVGASVEEQKLEEAKKKVKTGDDSVQGLTPDQVNQMQNQLFANMQKAKGLRKARKMTVKNIKALQKALMDGVYASVQDVDVVMNMNIDGKKSTTVKDVGAGEKPTEAVTTGKQAAVTTGAPDACVNLDQNKEAEALADALKPAAPGEKVDVIKAPASPVENMDIVSKGATTVTNPDGEKVPGGTKDADAHATEVPSLTPVKEESITENAGVSSDATTTTTVESKGTESATVVSEPSEAKGASSVADLEKKIAELEAEKKLLESAAVKIIERKNTLGDFAKGLSDKDILDDDKFEVLKVKAENKALKRQLNTASAHIAETSSVRSEDETKALAQEVSRKAQKMY